MTTRAKKHRALIVCPLLLATHTRLRHAVHHGMPQDMHCVRVCTTDLLLCVYWAAACWRLPWTEVAVLRGGMGLLCEACCILPAGCALAWPGLAWPASMPCVMFTTGPPVCCGLALGQLSPLLGAHTGPLELYLVIDPVINLWQVYVTSAVTLHNRDQGAWRWLHTCMHACKPHANAPAVVSAVPQAVAA